MRDFEIAFFELLERVRDVPVRIPSIAEQFAQRLHKLALDVLPALLEFAALLRRIEQSPPVKGYEDVLIAEGHHDRLAARILAANLLRLGREHRREICAERELSSAIFGVVKAGGATALVISRRAQSIKAALADRMAVPALDAAAVKAGISESAYSIANLAERAMARDAAGCRRLVQVCSAVQPHLVDPRGRIPSEASVTHEFQLHMLNRAYTYDSFNEVFSDPATRATCATMNIPTFDPRPARRRQKAREGR